MELQLYEEWAVGLRIPFDFFATDTVHFIELGYVNQACEAALGKKSKQCTSPCCPAAPPSLWGPEIPACRPLLPFPGSRYCSCGGRLDIWGLGGFNAPMPHRQAGTST